MRLEFNHEIGGRYLVKELRGEGVHGKVYRAYDAVRNGSVALKLFNVDAIDVQKAEAAHQFQVAEGSCILALLEVHPDFLEGPVTVMPLADGTYADPETVFASEAVYATRRVLTALEFCHGRDVVHGDVKPSNVFLDRASRVLLGDFGVAGYTLEYAAPELLAAGGQTIATDLWAAAVTFYELLCGRLPFGDRDETEEADVAERISQASYVSPDELLPFLPMRFRTFFRDAFRVDPSARMHTTAASMRGALRDLTVKVEWAQMRKQGCVFCFEGHAVSADAHRTGTTYEATVVERPRKRDFVPVIKKAPPDQVMRRLHGLPPYSGSKKQAGQQLSVWMRHLTETEDFRG